MAEFDLFGENVGVGTPARVNELITAHHFNLILNHRSHGVLGFWGFGV